MLRRVLNLRAIFILGSRNPQGPPVYSVCSVDRPIRHHAGAQTPGERVGWALC
jgi:hypothetical protein